MYINPSKLPCTSMNTLYLGKLVKFCAWMILWVICWIDYKVRLSYRLLCGGANSGLDGMWHRLRPSIGPFLSIELKHYLLSHLRQYPCSRMLWYWHALVTFQKLFWEVSVCVAVPVYESQTGGWWQNTGQTGLSTWCSWTTWPPAWLYPVLLYCSDPSFIMIFLIVFSHGPTV